MVRDYIPDRKPVRRAAPRTIEEDPNEVLSRIVHHSSQPTPVAESKKHRKQPTIPMRKVGIAAGVCIVLALIGYGGYTQREKIQEFIVPTPFSAEIKDKIGFTLYYPSDLPEEFKLATDTIQQPADDRLFYVISDTQGHSINVTLQKAVDGVDVVDKFDKESEPRQIETKLGKTSIFAAKDGIVAAVMPAKDTWIFVNMTENTLQDAQFETLLKSFRKG